MLRSATNSHGGRWLARASLMPCPPRPGPTPSILARGKILFISFDRVRLYIDIRCIEVGFCCFVLPQRAMGVGGIRVEIVCGLVGGRVPFQ